MADNNNYWLEQILNGNDMVLSKNIIDYEENRKDEIGLQLQHKLNELVRTNSILKHRMESAEAMLKELDTINRDNKKFLFDELFLPPPPRRLI
jgi:hypothetical protein